MFQITTMNYGSTIEILEQLISKLIDRRPANDDGSDEEILAKGLKVMVPFLQTIFSCRTEIPNRIDRCYRVYVEYKPKPNNANRMPQAAENSSEPSSNNENVKILHFWCFSPALRYVPLTEHGN